MKNAIAVVETGLSCTQGFDLCSREHHAGNISAFKEIIVGGLAVSDLQVKCFFAKVLVIRLPKFPKTSDVFKKMMVVKIYRLLIGGR